jgi:segregation and condensation protein B
MNTADVKRIIEAVLLCAQQPMPVVELRRLFADEVEVGADTVRALLDELRADWRGRGVELVALASGWRFQSTPDIARFVERLQPERPPRYSRAVLETLAIIAYRQPVTRGDIEEIRGVSVSAHIVKTLEDRGWIEVIGHKDVIGRPALFATTRRFLDDLSLRTLQELPALDAELPAADAIGQRLIGFAEAESPPGLPMSPSLVADQSPAAAVLAGTAAGRCADGADGSADSADGSADSADGPPDRPADGADGPEPPAPAPATAPVHSVAPDDPDASSALRPASAPDFQPDP